MNLRRHFLLLLAMMCGTAVLAQTSDLTEWLDAAQDSTGLVWGVPLARGCAVFVHDGSDWKPVAWSPAPGDGRARPVAIGSGPDGMVRIIWAAASDDTHWLTQHRGSSSGVVAQFTAKFQGPEFLEPFLFVDSKGNVWVTHKGPSILRTTRTGTLEEVYSIPKEHLLNVQDEKGRNSFFEAPRMLEDGRGHLWFWMEGRSNNVIRFDGFIEFDGSNFIHRTFSNIPPEARCYALEPEDQEHLLASFRGGGLYRIDLSTLVATRIEDPAPNAFRDVVQIFRSKGTDYVVAPSFYSRRDGDILWRWRPGEQAEKMTAGLGQVPAHSMPWLQLPEGLVLGATGIGLAFVPPNGDMQTLDWSSKVAARTPKRLFRTPSNDLLVVSGRAGSATAPLPPWPKPAGNPAFELINSKSGYARDSRGHVWAIDDIKRQLEEWDGYHWLPRPDSFSNKWFEALAVDSHDRVWIIGRDHGPYVWDQATSQWKEWPNTHEAVENYLREDPRFVIHPYYSWHMASSGDGRAILRQGTAGSAEYFDGKTWFKWRREQLGHGYPQSDRQGNFFIVGRDQAWQLAGDDWTPVSAADASRMPRPKIAWDAADSVVGRTKAGQDIVRDQNGDTWFTAERRLYRAHGDRQVPIFKENEANPFLDGRGLMNVIIDCADNVFLQTNINSSDWVLLHGQFLPPVGK
jgi:hypothetical protein